MERNYSTRTVGVWREVDALERRGAEHLTEENLSAFVVARAIKVWSDLSDDVVLVGGRIVLKVEHPHVVVAGHVGVAPAVHVRVGRNDRRGGRDHSVTVLIRTVVVSGDRYDLSNSCSGVVRNRGVRGYVCGYGGGCRGKVCRE